MFREDYDPNKKMLIVYNFPGILKIFLSFALGTAAKQRLNLYTIQYLIHNTYVLSGYY